MRERRTLVSMIKRRGGGIKNGSGEENQDNHLIRIRHRHQTMRRRWNCRTWRKMREEVVGLMRRLQ